MKVDTASGRAVLPSRRFLATSLSRIAYILCRLVLIFVVCHSYSHCKSCLTFEVLVYKSFLFIVDLMTVKSLFYYNISKHKF